MAGGTEPARLPALAQVSACKREEQVHVCDVSNFRADVMLIYGKITCLLYGKKSFHMLRLY